MEPNHEVRESATMPEYPVFWVTTCKSALNSRPWLRCILAVRNDVNFRDGQARILFDQNRRYRTRLAEKEY